MIGRIEKTCDYDGLAMVWYESVKSTHDFLSVEDIEFYHRRVPCDYMPEVELYAIRNDDGEWCAFIGLSAKMVEMLFVHPGAMGNGYGSALLDFAIKEKGIRRVYGHKNEASNGVNVGRWLNWLTASVMRG